MDRCAQLSLDWRVVAAAANKTPISSQEGVAQGFRSRRHQRSVTKNLQSFPPPQLGIAKFCSSYSFASPRVSLLVTTASAHSNEYEARSVGTPLELRTPEGKFLCGILKNHPHIFPVAASEQLEELATERDNALARLEHSAGSSESCLHGRIAGMKEVECQAAIEEVMYLLVVHNFYEIKVPMIPNLSKCTNDGRLEIWSSKIGELESIHGPEIVEMVREHLSNILRWKGSESEGKWCILKIKRLQLGRVYAASVMYGYFLKSVSLRHHLELSLPSMHLPAPRLQKQERRENLVSLRCVSDNTAASSSSSMSPSNPKGGTTASQLRGYMLSFDSKALQLCAKLRSREAANLIEKHTRALFGCPETDNVDDNEEEVIAVSASSLKRLVLEAVAFGSFLWEVEKYVDSVYSLKEN